ncbi:hypothetical protein Avbf_01372 [Armadillidium vulgare]|nr:hypothetical protein Avbf_01372 [Armadillidium vulgare]
MKIIGKTFNTDVQLRELQDFKKKYEGKFLSTEKSIDQAIENIKFNIMWKEKYYDVIINWFQQNGYKNDI